MEEIWVDIKGYEGAYQVSNLGRVRSLDRIDPHGGYYPRSLKGKLLKPLTNKSNPYTRVALSDRTKVYVHILVAEHFLGPKPFADAEVNHKNGVKTDCVYLNLEWVTPAQQIQHGYDTGLNKRWLTSEQIREIRSVFNTAKEKGTSTYGLGVYFADKFGVPVDLISRVKNRKSAKHVI